MSEPFIYCGTFDDGRVDVFDRGENLIKSIDLLREEIIDYRPTLTNLAYGDVNKIKVDSDGCIYVILNYGWGGGYINGGSVRKYGASGKLKWVQTNMWTCGHLDIDDNGNVYAVTPGTSPPGDWSGSIKKYNNDGVLQWAVQGGGLIYDPWYNNLIPIRVKSDGSLVVVSGIGFTTGYTWAGLYAYDGDGNLLWSNIDLYEIFALIIDEDDNDYIYAFGYGTRYKIDSTDGSVLAFVPRYSPIASYPISVAKDHNGDFIIAGRYTYKMNSDLTILWIGSLSGTDPIAGNNIWDIDCDNEGNLHVLEPDYTFRDNDAVRLWAYPNDVYRCLTVAYPISVPPLEIGLGLALPSWQGDRYTYSPALPLAIAYGIPLSRRDYLGRPLPLVYRAYLTGTPDLELPISSLQCRRDAAGTSLDLVVPDLDATTIAAIEARETGDIVVKRGIRFADGTEQLDEMFRIPLTGLRYDLGSQSGSASLTAADVTPAGGYARTLTGINYRNTIAANRRIRCAVDTYLLPGDTANLGGGETLTVAEIVYSIGPDSASMEVAE